MRLVVFNQPLAYHSNHGHIHDSTPPPTFTFSHTPHTTDMTTTALKAIVLQLKRLPFLLLQYPVLFLSNKFLWLFIYYGCVVLAFDLI